MALLFFQVLKITHMNARKGRAKETESRLKGCLGLLGRREWGVTANGSSVSFGVIKYGGIR